MMNINYYLTIYLFIISCFMFSYYFKHLLLMIISLEFIMLSVFYNLFHILLILEDNLILIIFFLVISVCEGSLSLSLIVMIVRYYGNDYINSLSILKW